MRDQCRVLYWPSYAFYVGQRVRKLRVMRGLTQERLAELAGLHRNAIVAIERNRTHRAQAADPRLSTIYRIVRALHVPPMVLLPDATAVLADTCNPHNSTLQRIDASWPTTSVDILPFDGSHLYTNDEPRFVDEKHPLNELRSPVVEELAKSIARAEAEALADKAIKARPHAQPTRASRAPAQ